MIRNSFIFFATLFALASCATNNGFQTTQTFEPASFKVSDVYVNMSDGVENSARIGKTMKYAGVNTAEIYNDAMASANAVFPLEIEVNEINFRKTQAVANSGDRTFLKYTAILLEEETGEVFRTLPVSYYHVSAGPITSAEAKKLAEKNMISNSIRSAFARLYGMEEVPQTVQTHFSTNDIFADPDAIIEEPVIKRVPPAKIVKPSIPVAEPVSTDGEPLVIKCVVC